ncbi:ScpA family protein [Ahrensia sp. R2A130]|uniref:segregation and condensation protein A n=1 Tax=Ahrensia sp. R2A130 TaxID=744979 RepID=UPI0001E0E85B|nr:ScpA family protein [Ahrensia sp. R2A130]EFL90385.1 ScpA/B protein [Ahrensia sp. R2A130]
MSEPAAKPDNNPDLWESATPVDRAVSDPGFTVDIDGYEGPLDLLLALARTQKVDLAKISILQLAVQYLEFVEKARKLRLELAADYLVMAAWLAFLKSKLLLPEPEEEEGPSGEDLANQLAFRLRRLEAMRDVSTRLMNRNRLGRDVFGRGDPEPVIVHREQRYNATMYDLLSAYAAQKQRQSVTTVTISQRQVWSLSEAREILARLIGGLADWTPLDVFLSRYLDEGSDRRGVLASTFAASLEMVREGKIEVQQAGNFEPLYMRRPTTKLTDSLAQTT